MIDIAHPIPRIVNAGIKMLKLITKWWTLTVNVYPDKNEAFPGPSILLPRQIYETLWCA